MLDHRLSELGDALARTYVMRMIDQHELEVLMPLGTPHANLKRSENELEVFRRREGWRQLQEEKHLRRVAGIEGDEAVLAGWQARWNRSALVRDAADDAAVSMLRVPWHLEGNPLRTTDMVSLFDPSRPHAAICEKIAKKLATSNNVAVEDMMHELAPNQQNASLRSILLTTSQQFRSALWLWQRDATISSLLKDRWKGSVSSAFRQVLDEQRRRLHHALLERVDSHSTNVVNGVLAPPVPSRPEVDGGWKWSPEVDAKWRAREALVVRLQACARRFLCRRRWAPALQKLATDKRLAVYHRVQQQLIPTSLRYIRQSHSTLQRYAELVLFVGKEQDRLEGFYETEEERFQTQWNHYVKRMTKFYLTECALDVDWMPQSNGSGGVVFLNTKTGRTQSEHPNTLKVVAAKNRQWLKATRDREARMQQARQATEELNHRKQELISLSKVLEAKLFL